MLKHSTRRWLAGLGVAGALVAASASPAAADESFQLVASDVLVAPDHTAYNYIAAWDPKTEVQELTLDLDLSQVDDFATLEPANMDWNCTRTDATLHCEAGAGEYGVPFFDYYLTAKADAEPGTKGELGIKATGDGQTATGSITVTVAEGVDLQSEPEESLEAAPGTVAALAGTVRNGGPNTARGAVLRMQNDYLSPYAGNFSNCEYIDSLATICTFDTELEPGKSYRLSEALPVKVEQEARSGTDLFNYLDWWTKDDWALIATDPSFPLPPGKPGTGEELRLVEVSGAQADKPQTDVDRWNSFTDVRITVTGDNTADLAAVGGTATGKVGDEVTVAAGVKNLGPALVEAWRLDGPLLVVDIPEGTTAVTVSDECAPYTKDEEWYPWETLGKPGADRYGCISFDDLAKDDSRSYEFTLKIDELATETSGAVTTQVAGDPNEANNQAAITVKLGTPGDGGNGGDGDGGEGGGDGDGGSLPITGANTGLIAGIGALLLAAGAAGFVVARRRKTRFVA